MEIEESLSFTCLPDHIWEKIFGYSGSLEVLMLTCKYFNDLISKSRGLMERMPLVLEASKYNNQENIAAILTSERKVSSVIIRTVDLFGYKFYKILDHFKKYTKKITFKLGIYLSPIVFIDIFGMLQNLEEVYIDPNIHLIENQTVVVGFKRGRVLKKAEIGDATILQYMPEIENLKCQTHSENSVRELMRYLESHSQLNKLNVSLRSADNFPSISLDDIQFDLFSFCLDCDYSYQYLNIHLIDFIKRQAESLQHLELVGFTYYFDIVQDLFDGMEELTYAEIWGEMELQTPEFVARNFECPKLKELRLNVDFEYPGFFRQFPKMQRLEFWNEASATMVDSAIQNCPNLSEIFIWTFYEAYKNATFPKLVKLEIYNLTEECQTIFEDFLVRHSKLKSFYFCILDDIVKEKVLWKFPALLQNLIIFKFDTYSMDSTKMI
jgi:hypothetical protein